MNEHPLSEDITQLSDEELEKKYSNLNRRWQIAKRMSMDPYVLHQLDIMLNGIENEKMRRMMLPDTGTSVVLETDPLEKKSS